MNQNSISKSMIMPYGERVGTKMGPRPNVVDKSFQKSFTQKAKTLARIKNKGF